MAGRAKALVLVVTVAAAGCGGSGRGPADGSTGDASRELTCQEIRDEWAAIVRSLSRSCGSTTECAVVGGSHSCDCYAHMAPDCVGLPVSQAAYTSNAAAADLWQRWWSSSCQEMLSGACDCGEGAPECRDGACVVDAVCRCMCWDAGPQDAPSDAATGDGATD